MRPGQLLLAQELDFDPGDKWAYSNLGYLTLGLVIHKVTGKFYGDFLQKRIFEKLGMNSTRIINEADIIPNRAAGYRLEKGEVVKIERNSTPRPSSQVKTTPVTLRAATSSRRRPTWTRR